MKIDCSRQLVTGHTDGRTEIVSEPKSTNTYNFSPIMAEKMKSKMPKKIEILASADKCLSINVIRILLGTETTLVAPIHSLRDSYTNVYFASMTVLGCKSHPKT